MCLALPAKVVAVQSQDEATVDMGGVQKAISLALLDEVAEGDYVIVHAGFALQVLDEEEAQQTLRLFAELNQMESTGASE